MSKAVARYTEPAVSIVKTNAVKNYVLPKMAFEPGSGSSALNPYTLPFTMRDAKLPQYYIMPLQLERIAHDVALWRAAIGAAENALYPTRYKMQKMYVDVILDGHTFACMEKRRNLTLLKDFVIQDEGGKINEDYTKFFKNKQWFNNLLTYILDAPAYGYSLIQLGNLESPRKGVYSFPQLTNIRRWNVEPDRQNLISIPLQKTGINFLDPSVKDTDGNSYSDWVVYVDTPTDIGHSICGYGFLYNTAIYGIILKNNLANNADYNQMFATPYRHAKTPMSFAPDKRAALEKAMMEMASAGWIVTDDGVTLEFKETGSGIGYKTYESLEKRCEQKISKIILGHADAMDSVPGKLGGGQGEDNPVAEALLVLEKKQDAFCLNVLNDVVLPRLRNIGIPIPDNFSFAVTNDKEMFEARKKEDEANKTTAEIAQNMKNAGLKMDAAYFEKRTGIKTTDAPEPAPSAGGFQFAQNMRVLKKLRNIYDGH